MVTTPLDRARSTVAAVLDPELPALSIEELGILRDVRVGDDGGVEVTITPTYSGCPAVEAIRRDVVQALSVAGFENVRVTTVLSPAWTTDWMTEQGRRKLAAYGIAPPPHRVHPGAGTGTGPVPVSLAVRCPQCGSVDTEELSRFGSTSCQSLWRCRSCREPFSHFKAL
jgi:ring-1,2-phenylacetyl-CoA epoxidase subunit PaaD